MQSLRRDVIAFARLVGRKWVLLLFLGIDAIGLLTQAFIPQLVVPTWAYAALLIVGLFIASYQVHQDLVAQLPSSYVEPPFFELLPSSFHVSYSPDISTIGVWLYAVNFLNRALTLDSILVNSLQMPAGPAIHDIPCSSSLQIPRGSFKEIWCQRSLQDGEVRALLKMEAKQPTNASVQLKASASAGRRHLSYETPHRTVNGWFSGTPPAP